MYGSSSSPNSRTIKPQNIFTDEFDEEIVADCAYEEKDFSSAFVEKPESFLIPRDSTCISPPATTKVLEEGVRYESRNDSGFDSFRSLGGLSEESSSVGYTRLYNTPQDCFLSNKNMCIDSNRSICPQQPQHQQYLLCASVSKPVDPSCFSYKPLSETGSEDISPSFELNDKLSNLYLSEKKSLKSLNSPPSGVGSSQLNFWYEAFKQDEDGDTFLHLVIIREMLEVISTFIINAPHPAFLNLQNNYRQTPLHLAVLIGLPKVVRNLVIHGALLEVRDHRGNTALHLACQKGDIACVEQLLQPLVYQEMDTSRPLNNLGDQWKNYGKTQNLELRNYEGQTCLHLATICKHVDVLELLHRAGADINAQEGKSGRAPLHFAVEMEDEVLTKLIINFKANLDLRTFAGLSPIQLADAVRNEKIKNLLTQQGAVYSDWESDDSSVEEMMIDNMEKSDFMINGQPLAW